jgi:hypothetical protein
LGNALLSEWQLSQLAKLLCPQKPAAKPRRNFMPCATSSYLLCLNEQPFFMADDLGPQSQTAFYNPNEVSNIDSQARSGYLADHGIQPVRSAEANRSSDKSSCANEPGFDPVPP